MDVKLDSEEMRSVISEALLRAIDVKTRDALIKESLQNLLEKPTGGGLYGTKTSPIEDAFRNAASVVAMQEARRLLESDADFLAKLQSMIADAVRLMTDTNREKCVSSLADTLATALLPKDRY